jgi:hypothetical protein
MYMIKTNGINNNPKQNDYPFNCFVSAFLAKIMSTSANVLLPIQRFWPSKCQPPGTLKEYNIT